MKRRGLWIGGCLLGLAGLSVLVLLGAYLWAVLVVGLVLVAPLLVGVRGRRSTGAGAAAGGGRGS